jgi:hypothetical protein
MSYFAPLPGKVANGNIRPRRILTQVTGAGNADKVVEATAANQILLGISYDATRYTPGSPADDGFVAVATEPCPYHGPGHICELDIGGTVDGSTGWLLTSDGSGLGVATAPGDGTTRYYIAVALQSGVSGETIKVVVLAPTPTV